MKKIPSLFQRDFENDPSRVLRRVTPGCEWAIEGEGFATVKWDGTSCLIGPGEPDEVIIWKRYDAKPGRTPPDGFRPTDPKPDPVTKHHPGWVPCKRDDPADRWHFEAFDPLYATAGGILASTEVTYELIGPKIQGNPYDLDRHILLPHGQVFASDLRVPSNYETLAAYLARHPIEGIVWWHPDGRMTKVKAREFGLQWPRLGEPHVDPFTNPLGIAS